MSIKILNGTADLTHSSHVGALARFVHKIHLLDATPAALCLPLTPTASKIVHDLRLIFLLMNLTRAMYVTERYVLNSTVLYSTVQVASSKQWSFMPVSCLHV